MKIIALSGTKGKTMTVTLIDYILQNLKYSVFKTDTEAVYKNGKTIISESLSEEIWGLKPYYYPGRYISPNTNKILDAIIFEVPLGNYKYGLGYSFHDIGIVTNIFFDGINNTQGIKNVGDISKRKCEMILKNIIPTEKGTAIINIDQEEILGQVHLIPDKVKIVGFGQKTTEKLDIDYFFEIKNTNVSLYKKNVKEKLFFLNTKEVSITFGGKYMPSIYNITCSLATVFVYLGEEDFIENQDKIQSILMSYMTDSKSMRLNFFKKEGKNIFVDFAHEEESLQKIGELIEGLKSKGSKAHVIFRLATNIKGRFTDFAKILDTHFDTISIYDHYDENFTRDWFSEAFDYFKK